MDDPLSPLLAGLPFDAEGVSRRRTTLVQQGVVANLTYDSAAARTAGTASGGVNRILWPCRCRSRTVIWWRRARISTSMARSLMGSRRSLANVFVTVRYTSRSSTGRHHRLAAYVDSRCAGEWARTDAVTVSRFVLTRRDGIVGTRRGGMPILVLCAAEPIVSAYVSRGFVTLKLHPHTPVPGRLAWDAAKPEWAEWNSA